jgi:metal-responsive CopG/Arc/MetJ family transcriptional regulator
MTNKLISLRISDILLKNIENESNNEGFSNIQEFIRHCIREKLRKNEMEKQINDLNKLYGKYKTYNPKTKKEIENHIKKIYS